MAYRKRRYNRRYKNKTKKFNRYAYAKTDSKNQSKQIVRLNKKIDNVYKTLKPEIIKTYATGTFNISSSAPVVLPFESLINASSTAAIVDLFKGDYTKFIYYNFKFFFNSGDVDLTKGKTLRIIIFQSRNNLSAAPTASYILSDESQAIISSLVLGINNDYKILLNKTYIISSDRDYLYKTYNFKKLIGYNKKFGPGSAYGRGSIFIMFITTQTDEFSIKWNSSLGRVDTVY